MRSLASTGVETRSTVTTCSATTEKLSSKVRPERVKPRRRQRRPATSTTTSTAPVKQTREKQKRTGNIQVEYSSPDDGETAAPR
jgi:hypothetical protein